METKKWSIRLFIIFNLFYHNQSTISQQISHACPHLYRHTILNGVTYFLIVVSLFTFFFEICCDFRASSKHTNYKKIISAEEKSDDERRSTTIEKPKANFNY